MRGLVSYATYLLLATLYNIEASRTVHHSVSELTSNRRCFPVDAS